eukprot:s298_g21.t3
MTMLGKMASYWPMSSWPLTFLACSGGFSNILSLGLCDRIAKPRLESGLTSALAALHDEDSYKPRFELLQLKSDMMGISSKFAIVMGVSFSQALYALPLAVATSSSPLRARPVLKAVGWAGVGIAGIGLLIETLADEHKLAAKREAPRLPVMDGLLLQAGWKILSTVFPTFFMAFTLKNSAARSDKEADHRYRNCDGYAQWAENTPVFIPGDLVGIGDAAFCKKVGAKLKEYQEWMEEWPYSEQARALSWLEPKKSSASPSGGWSPVLIGLNSKRFQNACAVEVDPRIRKGSEIEDSKGKGAGQNGAGTRREVSLLVVTTSSNAVSRRPMIGRNASQGPSFEGGQRAKFLRKFDSVYQDVRLRLLNALLQSDFNGRQYNSKFCNQAIGQIADQKRLSYQVRMVARAVASATGGHAGRTAALRKQLTLLQERTIAD